MRFLPVGLDIRDRKCLVVGAGAVGTRKARTLVSAGASVLVVSPEGTEEMEKMAASGALRWLREPFRPAHLDGVFLAVAATSDQKLNALLVERSRGRGALVCDASSSERTELIFGALHQEEGFMVAVFTDGRDPSMARRTRDRISTFLKEGGAPVEPPPEGEG